LRSQKRSGLQQLAPPTVWSDAARRRRAGYRSWHLIPSENHTNSPKNTKNVTNEAVYRLQADRCGARASTAAETGKTSTDTAFWVVMRVETFVNTDPLRVAVFLDLLRPCRVAFELFYQLIMAQSVRRHVFPENQGFRSLCETGALFAIQRSLWEITLHFEAKWQQTLLYGALKPWESGLRLSEAALVSDLLGFATFPEKMENKRTEKCLNQHAAKTRHRLGKVFAKQCN